MVILYPYVTQQVSLTRGAIKGIVSSFKTTVKWFTVCPENAFPNSSCQRTSIQETDTQWPPAGHEKPILTILCETCWQQEEKQDDLNPHSDPVNHVISDCYHQSKVLSIKLDEKLCPVAKALQFGVSKASVILASVSHLNIWDNKLQCRRFSHEGKLRL